MNGPGDPWSAETVELILYELRPNSPKKIAEIKWVQITRLPFLGRTLCRGPAKNYSTTRTRVF